MFKFAWRNLGRNIKRSMITGVGIALGVAMCMGTLGIMEGLNKNLIQGTTEGEVGHIQIHNPDYLLKRQTLHTINDVQTLLDDSLATTGITGASARLYSWGYLSKGSKSIGVQLMGLDALTEDEVTRIPRQLISGRFFGGPTPWGESRALSKAQLDLDRSLTEREIERAFAQFEQLTTANDRVDTVDDETKKLVEQIAPLPDVKPEVVLGYKLAKNLSADLGDTLTLLYENSLGAQGSIQVTLSGTSKQGIDLTDRTRVILHLHDLQKMLQLDNQAHQIALSVDAPKEIDEIKTQLSNRITNTDSQTLLIQLWSELRPDILALILSNQALIGSLVFIIFLIAGVSVLNTMLVSVMERQKELSMMKALGFSASKVTLLIVYETMILTFIACLLGSFLGLLLSYYFKVVGWDISNFGEFSLLGVGMAPVIQADITLNSIVIPLIAIFVIALVAAIYPAIKAARVSPAIGMRSS